jgi:cation diffusion facilitator family transporter
VQDGSRKAIIAAFGANLGIAVAKFIGFAITGSAGLLAEAAHSVADTGNQGLLLLGTKRSERPATDNHPFGFGRERYFWAFVVALVLFSMGGLFALYEGVDKLRHPHATEHAVVAFVIIGIAIALETFSLRTAMREANHIRPPSTSWWQYIKTAKQPELPIVLLEDLGAELGLAFALAGLILAEATHNPRFDAAGSLAIGVLLVIVAAVLAIEMKGLLIGEAAAPHEQDTVRAALARSPHVRRIIHLRTQHLGPDELLVAAKLEFAPDVTVAELAGQIDETEAIVRAALPSAKVMYIEPDIHRESSE